MSYRNWDNKKRTQFILDRLQSRDIPATHVEMIQGWLISEDGNEEKGALLENIFVNMISAEAKPSPRAYELLGDLHKRLGISTPVKKTVSLSRRLLTRAAAILLPLLIVSGAAFLYKHQQPSEIIKQKILTVSTSEQTVEEVLLPDSSKIWVASSSRVSFNENFSHGRCVELDGEAHFDIQKHDNEPFIVEADNMTVRVLGTEFCISEDNSNGKNRVFLYSGIVEVTTASGSVTLEPGNMLEYDYIAENIQIHPIPENHIDWRYSDLNFKYEPVSKILDRLAHYYRADIAYPQNINDFAEISISFEGSEPLQEAVRMVMAMVDGFKWEIDGNKVKIY